MVAPNNSKGSSLGVAATRVFWMMIGPLALALLAFRLASMGGGWLTGLDIAYLFVLGLVLTARSLEYGSGEGQTAEGQPLTRAGLSRYLALAVSVGLVVWVGANLIGNVWLVR